MASVTFGTSGPSQQRHALGDLIMRTYVINGASGSTFVCPQSNIQLAVVQQSNQGGTASVITSFSLSGGTYTFTASGTMVNEVFAVFSRIG